MHNQVTWQIAVHRKTHHCEATVRLQATVRCSSVNPFFYFDTYKL